MHLHSLWHLPLVNIVYGYVVFDAEPLYGLAQLCFPLVLVARVSRSDVPGWPADESTPLRPSGRGRGIWCQTAASTSDPESRPSISNQTSMLPEPLFRVKRWRKDSAANFVNPSPKASAITPKGSLSSKYRPPSLCVAPLGGLPPPSPRKRVYPQAHLSNDGLHYTAPTKLLVHSMAFKTRLAHVSSSPSMQVIKRPGNSSDDHCLSATLDLSTSVAKPMSTDTTTMLALHQQLKEQHHVEWLRILEVAADESDLVKSTRDSENGTLHRARVIAKFSPSTLASYFRCWHQWTSFCQCHDANPHQPQVVLLADFLQVSSKRSALGVATAHSRALTWMSKYAGFPILKQALEAPITRAYTIPSEVVPRKEAAPLPLSFVVYLESCILKDLGTPADRLVMGSILALVWASLRWSDALWVSPSDLVEDADIIRGVGHKTKTTSRGMPFALVKSGLLGVKISSVSWATKWLNLVRQALQRTTEVFPGFKPDFLLPQCGPNLEHPLVSAPLSRAQGVLMLRNLIKQSHNEASVLIASASTRQRSQS